MSMRGFEWDPIKSEQNKRKHGVSFINAVQIWQSVHVSVKNIACIKEGETRSATIGLIDGKLYTAIWTKRKDAIRLISVRRSRDGEKEIFWKKTV